MLEHAPRRKRLAQLARRLEQRANAKRIGYHQRASLTERANFEFDGNDEPVVTVGHRKLDQQQAKQIGWARIYRAEVHLRIFKFPEPWRRHAAKTHWCGNGRLRNLFEGFVPRSANRHLIRVEVAPVQMAFKVLLRRQHALAIAETRAH